MTVICSSSNPLQLRSALEDFDPASVRGIISFGVAGGLDPTLATGDIVVATDVVTQTGRWTAAAGLSGELIGAVGDGVRSVRRGILAGSEIVVPSPGDKAALRAATAAVAVDMESHIAASYAAGAGLPFAALRVVSDPASRALPAIATHALKPDGRVDVWKVLRAVAREPSAVPQLMRTGRDFNRALVTLRGCRRLLLGDSGRLLGGGGSLVTADL
jgi:hopanoid-associated phosphorylase